MGVGGTCGVARRAGREWSRSVCPGEPVYWKTLPPPHQQHAESLPYQVGRFAWASLVLLALKHTTGGKWQVIGAT